MNTFSKDDLYGLFIEPTLLVPTTDGYKLVLEKLANENSNSSAMAVLHRGKQYSNVSVSFTKSFSTLDDCSDARKQGFFEPKFGYALSLCKEFADMSFLFPLLKDLNMVQRKVPAGRIPAWFHAGRGVSECASSRRMAKWFLPNADKGDPYTQFLEYEHRMERDGVSFKIVGEWTLRMVGAVGGKKIASCDWNDKDGLASLIARMKDTETTTIEVALTDPTQAKGLAKSDLWVRASVATGKRILPLNSRVNLKAAKALQKTIFPRFGTAVNYYPSVDNKKGEERELPVNVTLPIRTRTVSEIVFEYSTFLKNTRAKRLNLLSVEKDSNKRYFLVGDVEASVAAMTVMHCGRKTYLGGWEPRVDQYDKPITAPWDGIKISYYDVTREEWVPVVGPTLQDLV